MRSLFGEPCENRYPLHCPALFRCAIASLHHLLHPLPVPPLRLHSFKQASKEQLTPAAIALGVAIELTPDRTTTAEIASKRRCMGIPLKYEYAQIANIGNVPNSTATRKRRPRLSWVKN